MGQSNFSIELSNRRAASARCGLKVILAAALACSSQAGLAGSGAGAAPSKPSKAAPLDPRLRLEAIGYRLSRANAGHCTVPDMLTGLMLHNVGGYDRVDRADIMAAYGMTLGFGVLQVVPGSAAARAGFQQDDELVTLDGADLTTFAADAVGDRGSYARTERMITLLQQKLSRGPAQLGVRRGGAPISLTLSGEPGCGGRFAVLHDRALNAWSDGRYVAVTDRMMSFVQDDAELAFIVAHEMAHNLLHHADQTKGISRLFAEFGFGAKRIKSAEVAADGLAVDLLAQAGYSLTAPEQVLRRLAPGQALNLGITHPGITRRIAIVRLAATRVQLARSN